MTYSELLKDPRWLKKRLEILQRDEWMCRRCYDSDTTLVVHHRRYISNLLPWEYDDSLLVTLCEECHKTETEQISDSVTVLVDKVKEKFFSDDILRLACGISLMDTTGYSEVVASIYEYAFPNREINTILKNMFFQSIKTSLHKKGLL